MDGKQEIAKAVGEVAKLGGKCSELVEKVGGFVADVLKGPADEISVIVTDKLRFVRWRRLDKMADEVNQILESKGVKDTRAVAPKLALPIFEDASLEEDQELQKLWNQLLANAMDPSFNSEIRYGFIDMIKGITGKEAQLINRFYVAL